MKRITAFFLGLALAGPIPAQFLVFDAAQEGHVLQQIGADAKKLANQQMSLAQQVQMLAKLDMEILRQTAILEQAVYAAKYFDANAKRTWVSAGNMVVSNWTTPSYYGETALWGAAVNTGAAPQSAWQQAALAMQKGLYIALDPISAAAFDKLIGELSRGLRLTVFMITHDLDSLYAITDQVAVIADKKVVAMAPVRELENFDHPWIQEYFHGPRGRAAASVQEPGARDLETAGNRG